MIIGMMKVQRSYIWIRVVGAAGVGGCFAWHVLREPAALNGFYWRVINILQSVIGLEPWDFVGTMITANIPIKTD